MTLRRIALVAIVLSQAACAAPETHHAPKFSRVNQLRPIRGIVEALAWSPNGKYLASAMNDQTIAILDVDSGKVAQTLTGHESVRFAHINCIQWSPDGKHLASSSNDQTVRIWDTDHGQQVNLWRCQSWIKAVVWSPDGSRIAVGGEDNKITILDFEGMTPLLEFSGHSSSILAVAWSPDGKRCASSSVEESIRMWDSTSGNQIAMLSGHGGIPDEPFSRRWPVIYSLVWSADGSRLASSANDWTCRIWDTATYKEVIKLQHTAPVGASTWSNDGKFIASVSSEPQRHFGNPPRYQTFVRIWNPKDGSLFSKFEGGVPAWNPTSKELAVAHGHTIEIWSLGEQDELIQ